MEAKAFRTAGPAVRTVRKDRRAERPRHREAKAVLGEALADGEQQCEPAGGKSGRSFRVKPERVARRICPAAKASRSGEAPAIGGESRPWGTAGGRDPRKRSTSRNEETQGRSREGWRRHRKGTAQTTPPFAGYTGYRLRQRSRDPGSRRRFRVTPESQFIPKTRKGRGRGPQPDPRSPLGGIRRHRDRTW